METKLFWLLTSFLSLFYISITDGLLNFIQIQPTFEFHDRRGHFLITCNASLKTDSVTMFFQYKDNNYTVPRINNVPGVYVGNFSAVAQNQTKVMILCVDLNSGKLLGAKVYVLGYPPSIIPQHYNVDLSCRGFSLLRTVCSISPTTEVIVNLLGFESHRNGEFKATLFYSDSDSEGITPVNSVYNLRNYVAAPTISLHLVIDNMLGNITYKFSFDLKYIQKPTEPKIEIKSHDRTSFSFTVVMTDYGAYQVTVVCNSVSPRRTQKNLSFKLIGAESKPIFIDNWAINSAVICSFRAQTIFGNATIGSPSDKSSVELKLQEGKPVTGPYISPLLVDYVSISDNGLLSDVTVYFIDLDVVYRNGVIIEYKWKCDECYVNKLNVTGIIHDLLPGNRSIRLQSVSIGSNFSMTACTSDGCSLSWTTFRFIGLRDDVPGRRLSIINTSIDPDNVTLIWYDKPNVDSPLRLLVCSMTLSEVQCSSVESIVLTEDGMRQFQIKDGKKWKFALLSSDNDGRYKLRWTSCVYNFVTPPAEKNMLQELDYNMYVKRRMDCTFYRCQVHYEIDIPSCDKSPDVFFHELNVVYENSSLTTATIRVPLTSSNRVQFTLIGMYPGWRRYSANISVNTLANRTVPWFQVSHTTNFWCTANLLYIVFAIIALIAFMIVILCLLKQKIKNKYFKKMFHSKPRDTMMRNHYYTQVEILNANTNSGYTVAHTSPSIIDRNNLLSQEKESTQTTSVNVTAGLINNFEEGLINLSVDDTISYTARPLTAMDHYSHIAVPANKDVHGDGQVDTTRIMLLIQ